MLRNGRYQGRYSAVDRCPIRYHPADLIPREHRPSASHLEIRFHVHKKRALQIDRTSEMAHDDHEVCITHDPF